VVGSPARKISRTVLFLAGILLIAPAIYLNIDGLPPLPFIHHIIQVMPVLSLTKSLFHRQGARLVHKRPAEARDQFSVG